MVKSSPQTLKDETQSCGGSCRNLLHWKMFVEVVVSNREENIQIDKNIDENLFFPRSEARSPPFSMACSCATVPICAKLPMIILYIR